MRSLGAYFIQFDISSLTYNPLNQDVITKGASSRGVLSAVHAVMIPPMV